MFNPVIYCFERPKFDTAGCCIYEIGTRLTISTDSSNSVAAVVWDRCSPGQRLWLALRRSVRTASVCLAFYWLLIFTGTHLPTTAMPQVTLSDKLCHALAYGGLSFLLAWALPYRGVRSRHVGWAVGIALIYSWVDELTQNFIPGRNCELGDMAADAAGIVIGVCCYLALRQTLLSMHWGRQLLHALAR